MGDVVLTNVLIDKGLMSEDVAPRPDVFIIAATDTGAAQVSGIVAKLRRTGLHVRFNYKTTRNVGKLLKDAVAVKARYAMIVGDTPGSVQCKDLGSGEQVECALADAVLRIRG